MPDSPLALTAAVYNMDGGSTIGPSHDVAVAGEGKISLQDDLANGAAREGRHLSPDPEPERGLFFPVRPFQFRQGRRSGDLVPPRTGSVRWRRGSRQSRIRRLHRESLSSTRGRVLRNMESQRHGDGYRAALHDRTGNGELAQMAAMAGGLGVQSHPRRHGEHAEVTAFQIERKSKLRPGYGPSRFRDPSQRPKRWRFSSGVSFATGIFR